MKVYHSMQYFEINFVKLRIIGSGLDMCKLLASYLAYDYFHYELSGIHIDAVNPACQRD